MSTHTVLSLFAALGLVLIHLLAGKLRFLQVVPRSRWLSFAGGVSTAYALVYLLPELAQHRGAVGQISQETVLQDAFYLLTLAGLVIFYGLEKVAQTKHVDPANDEAGSGVFWIHICSFALYNALIGYALVDEYRDLQSLSLFFVALGLHFLVNDYGLRHHHQEQYRRRGRWIISAAIAGGWTIGAVATIAEALTAAIVGFLAGGILLNTFKEELPKERESRFWAFGLGATLYAGLLLII